MAKEQGLVQLYYGDGKGKTTAVFGLAFRCAGWGRRVVVAQFLKSGAGGEGKAVERFPEITLLRTKGVNKFTFQMNDDEKAETAENCLSLFRQAVELARQEQARLLVLDEVIDATYGFLPMEELCAFLDGRPEGMEVAITGHSLPRSWPSGRTIFPTWKEKHPYDRGVMARKRSNFKKRTKTCFVRLPLSPAVWAGAQPVFSPGPGRSA